MTDNELMTILRSTDLLAQLPEDALGAIAAEVEWRSLRAGETLMTEGDPGDALYLLVRGRLRVYGMQPEGPVVLNEIAPGELVGEFAVLIDQPRSATVRAIRDSELLRLSAEAFHRLVAKTPEALLQLTRALVARLVEPSAKRFTGRVRTIAVVPAGDTDIATVDAFSRDLVQALSGHGSADLVDRDRVSDIDDNRVVELLDQMERGNEFVVYRTDDRSSAWTDRCLRQVDRVLLVAGPHAKPELGPAESGAGLARRDLVVLQERATTWPTKTAAWLARRSVTAHYQVRMGNTSDYRRLARRVAGRAVGLVLGGGGPRGFAHLGAMQALEEFGIPIDYVGGTSIGALMGAAYAIGWDHRTRVERITTALTGQGALFRPTLPLVSLSSGRRVSELLRHEEYLGDRQIEDFWLPYFCVSTNLTKGQVVVHDRGSAWRAVRASVALPGVLPPVFAGGDLLVDGGVLDNLPVDIMRARLEGSVVAVDLEPDIDLKFEHEFHPALSGWQVLARRWHPFRPRYDVPNAVQLLLMAKQVGITQGQRAMLASHPVELYLRPPADATGGLNFKAAASLVEIGYRYTVEMLERADLRSLSA